MIDKPGIYTIPAEEYHADPCPEPSLSASIAKIISTQSPLHAWTAHSRLNPAYEPQEDARFDRGSAAHALLLEGANRMQVIDAKDYRTKAAQEQRDAARAAGKFPILLADYADVIAMRDVALAAFANVSEVQIDLDDGLPEQTLIWHEDDIWLRVRTDWLRRARDLVLDYKTTTDSSPSGFNRQISRMGYHIQAAFYERGVKALTGIEPTFILAAQEVDPPYSVSFHGIAPSMMEIARFEVSRAITIWRKCIKSGKWPGYPQVIHWAEAAQWQAMEYEERQASGIPYDIARLWEKQA